MSSKNVILFFLPIVIFAAGCSPERQLASAQKLEKKGKYYKAWGRYQEIAANNPQSAVAPEAIFRAGWVAQRNFDDCYMAGTFYDDILDRYPDSEPWAQVALLQKNSCPDYFPLIAGSSWTEVDSDTKGANARVEILCEPSGEPRSMPGQSGKIVKNYYAGAKKSFSFEIVYKKEEHALKEYKPGQENLAIDILKWPVEVGSKWVNRVDGRAVNYEIVSIEALVSVLAGEFTQCLHVRSYVNGDPGVKNEYYEPGIGRVLTSISSKGGEKRITELSVYKIEDSQL